MASRRFPPPRKIERAPGRWKVVDANGQAVAFTYGRNDQGVNSQHLTVGEARPSTGRAASRASNAERSGDRDLTGIP